MAQRPEGGEKEVAKPARRLSVYIPQSKRKFRPIERMRKLARKRKSSINDLVVEALIQFLEREERRRKRS